MNDSKVWRWMRNLNEGRENINDEEWSARPSLICNDLLTNVEEYRQPSIHHYNTVNAFSSTLSLTILGDCQDDQFFLDIFFFYICVGKLNHLVAFFIKQYSKNILIAYNCCTCSLTPCVNAISEITNCVCQLFKMISTSIYLPNIKC